MTKPRQVIPGCMYLVTARAVARSYRFVPTPLVVAILWFCFGAIVFKYRKKIAMHEFIFMSNHFHLVLTDINGCLPDFMRDLNSLLSRALNARRGTRGTNFEKGYHAELILDDETMLTHCVYTLANACAADIVNHASSWKSVSSLGLEYGRSRRVKRPKFGLWAPPKPASSEERSRPRRRRRIKFEQVIRLFLVRPKIFPGIGDRELRALIRDRLAARETAHRERRQREGKKVQGWDRATRVPYTYIPPGEQLFGKAPVAAAQRREIKVAAELKYAAFVDAYHAAIKAYRAGKTDVVFPYGTWKMRQRLGVVCAGPPTQPQAA